MNIKKTIATTIMTLTMTSMAGGLYIVSGGDFRLPVLEYIVPTTQNNQEVNISPRSATTGAKYSVKTERQEMQCTSGEYVAHTFPSMGNHLVKVFSTTPNLNTKYVFNYAENTNITPMSSILIRGENVNVDIKYSQITNATLKDVRVVGSWMFAMCTKLVDVQFIGRQPEVL